MSNGEVRNGEVRTATADPTLVECSLYAEFGVVIPDIDWCPLADLDLPVTVQNQRFRGGTCLIDVRVEDDDETRIARITQECDRRCACEVLTTLGCVPQLKEIRNDRLVIGAYLDEQTSVRDIVERLRTVAERVSLRRLTRLENDDPAVTTVLDLTDLTNTQRETVTLALSKGYYRQPRRASVTDLAEEFGVSPAAVSQRLSGVESKVMRKVFADE